MIDLTKLPIDITKDILNFRKFLNSCWPSLDDLIKSHDWKEDAVFLYDWMQMNWEFLIERELLGNDKYLLPLEWDKRVTFPEKTAQYKVVCETTTSFELKDRLFKKQNYNGEELLISGFRSPYEISYSPYPPFDYIQASTYKRKKLYIIPVNYCRFWLKLICGDADD